MLLLTRTFTPVLLLLVLACAALTFVNIQLADCHEQFSTRVFIELMNFKTNGNQVKSLPDMILNKFIRTMESYAARHYLPKTNGHLKDFWVQI